MIYIKTFESSKPYREVDLQLLWDDLMYGPYYPILIDVFYENLVKKMLQDKEICFNMILECGYAYKGRAKEIFIRPIDSNNAHKIDVILYDSRKEPWNIASISVLKYPSIVFFLLY